MDAVASTVLVVDDNPVNRKILNRQLQKQGHVVNLAKNGEEALEKMKAQQFDIVLLDILMPVMDGFEVLEQLRDNNDLRNIPVIVISSLDDIDSLVKCIELGADDYLPQPFNPVLLQARLDASLEKKRLRDQEQAYLVAAKQQTEEALQESEARLDTVVSSASIVLFAIDRNNRFSLVEGRGLETLGIKSEDYVGKSLADVALRVPKLEKEIQRVFKGEDFKSTIEIGEIVWEVHFSPITDAGGKINGALGVATDISVRKRAEEEKERLFDELRKSHQRLQVMSQRLVEVQENERRYIARELHDEIGQSLTGLKISLEMGLRTLTGEHGPYLKEAQKLADELMTIVREMSLNLRPTMLDDLGVLAALVWHFERFTTQTSIRVNFDHKEIERRFLPQLETALYRIVQEALTNIARHAKVDEVFVELWADNDRVHLVIRDEGVGFDPKAALAANASSGLAGMHERVKLLRGHIEIKSSVKKGTILTAELPIADSSAVGEEE